MSQQHITILFQDGGDKDRDIEKKRSRTRSKSREGSDIGDSKRRKLDASPYAEGNKSYNICCEFILDIEASSLTLFQTNKPWFLCACSTSLLKTLWKMEKLIVTSNFSFSHSFFYPFRELSAIFIKFKFVVCKLFQFGSI